MEDLKTVRQLQRKALLVNLLGRLAVLSDDEGREFDSLMTRIHKRVDYYESLYGAVK
jgi:hypothetical protein